MTQPASPPSGTPPRVHHSNTTPAASGAAPSDQISQADYQNPAVADYLVGHAPAQIIYINGQPQDASKVAPAPATNPVMTLEQAVDKLIAQLRIAFLTQPATLWTSIGDTIKLGFVVEQIDPSVVRIGLPFNNVQVLAGGMATIRAVQGYQKAQTLEVDINALGQEVGTALRLQRPRDVLESSLRIVDANQTVALRSVADRVEKGLTVGESVIKADGHLAYLLKEATDIRGEPTSAGVANRAANARTEDAIRADEQAKAQAGTAPVTSPGTAVTVTAQTPGEPPGTAVPQPATGIKARGHKKA